MKSLAHEIETRTPAGYPTMPGYEAGQSGRARDAWGASSETHTQDPYSAGYSQDPYGAGHSEGGAGRQRLSDSTMETFEQAYRMPAADAVDRGRMTYDDVIVRTGTLLGILILSGIAGFLTLKTNPAVAFPVMIAATIVGFVLAMIVIFSKKIRPGLIMAYAVAEGAAVGVLSAFFEQTYPGVVVQAVLATFVVMVVALGLFSFAKVRLSSKMMRFLIIGLTSLVIYRLVSAILIVTGVVSTPFGIDGMTIMGIPIGIAVGVFAILLATMSLIGDYEIAEAGVQAGVPSVFAWRVAFGILVTVVWLYLEILRLIAIVRSN